MPDPTILDRTRDHKLALTRLEAHLAKDRRRLREMIRECIAERYRPSEIARELGISRSRLDQLAKSAVEEDS